MWWMQESNIFYEMWFLPDLSPLAVLILGQTDNPRVVLVRAHYKIMSAGEGKNVPVFRAAAAARKPLNML